ncbi:MAG: DUF4372 domain-containing protein [Deltaproteobacteria bacterium]|nr:DUF4372 domain-containing protein [Deltaproteobacteria bacterium]
MLRCASLFSQLIGLFNRQQFYRLVIKHKTERHSKGYNSWDHFTAINRDALKFLSFFRCV